MLAVAYLEADARLGRPNLREAAARLLERLIKSGLTPVGGMLHAEGVAGQLGDQVWALLAAVRAFQAGLGESWRTTAEKLAAHLEAAYADAELGGYFDHAGEDELGRLSDRLKPLAENSLAAVALHELGETERAAGALQSIASLPRQYGLMAAVFARALDRVRRPPIKITTLNRELARAALAAQPYAALELGGDERAVVCLGTVCLAPVATPEAVVDAVATRV
jgi:uncharacterized protein YyaL (SSP411 family)